MKLLQNILFIAFLLSLSACFNEENKQWQVGGDFREVTNSIETLPSMLDEKDDNIKKTYLLAAEHYELLTQMPCYCGCSISAGHKDNASCFLYELNADGTVIWDDHGSKCMTCIEIAVNAVDMYKQGKTPLQIRTFIDEHYAGKGYPAPTETPMPLQ